MITIGKVYEAKYWSEWINGSDFRYSLYEDFTEPPLPQTTFPPGTTTTTQTNVYVNFTTQNSNTIPYVNGTTSKPVSRKGGIIFPSVKNKPSVVNSTFATDALSYKDVKVTSDILFLVHLVMQLKIFRSRDFHASIYKMLAWDIPVFIIYKSEVQPIGSWKCSVNKKSLMVDGR